MHKIDSEPITMEMFSFDNDGSEPFNTNEWAEEVVDLCEVLRQKYKETGEKCYWRALVQILPNAWMQTRTVTLNYQVARAMYFARRFHKLTEWHTLCDVFMSLPYGEELIGYEKPNKNKKVLDFIYNKVSIPKKFLPEPEEVWEFIKYYFSKEKDEDDD